MEHLYLRWVSATTTIKQSNKEKVGNSLQLPSTSDTLIVDADVSKILKTRESAVIYDVEEMDLDTKSEKSPASKGLKSLAKMFSKTKNQVTDTPTIFALLKASHIISELFDASSLLIQVEKTKVFYMIPVCHKKHIHF